jgi:hypothetical protein
MGCVAPLDSAAALAHPDFDEKGECSDVSVPPIAVKHILLRMPAPKTTKPVENRSKLGEK